MTRRMHQTTRFRKELVTRRDCSFDGQPIYWYSTGYDLLGRPTNATDSASLAREWLYNRRFELAAASIGTNHYGYAFCGNLRVRLKREQRERHRERYCRRIE